jgi:low affinity Fe/Cu permease
VTGESWFLRLAKRAAHAAGRPTAFVIAVAMLLAWAVSGPVFGFSDTWQLVVNTGTTIVTFLMVFLIQNTQNRDTTAIHIKLDELIRVNREARNALLNSEELTDEELEEIRAEYGALASDPSTASAAVDLVRRSGVRRSRKRPTTSGGRNGSV